MEPRREALEKEVRLSYGRGKRSYVSVVREHYLREDISCQSELCVLCSDLPSQRNGGATTVKCRTDLFIRVSVRACVFVIEFLLFDLLVALREGLKKLFHTHSVSSSTEIFSKRRKIYSL